MADAISLTLSNGDSPSIVVSASNSVSTLVATPDSSVSLDVSPASNASVSINTVPTTQLSVSTLGSTVSTVSQLNNSLTVSTALQTPLRLNLRDLEDVSGDPTDDQVLVYDQPTNSFIFEDQSGGGGGGSSTGVISSDITVTNTDGAFTTLNGITLQNNTTIESILQQILSPYVRAKFNQTTLIGTASNQGNISLSGSTTLTLEVGANVSIPTINYGLTLTENVLDNSVALERSINDGAFADYASGLSDSPSGNVTLGTEIGVTASSRLKHEYRFSATDNGNPNGQTATIYSNQKTISWENIVYLLGSSTVISASSSHSDFNSLIGSSPSDSFFSNDPGSNSFVLNCSANNQLESNISYIAYPAEWGLLDTVLQNNSTDASTDWVPVEKSGGDGTFTRTNIHGVTIPYYLYRTNDLGAYHADVTLTVTLT